jgi:hypothetical protein
VRAILLIAWCIVLAVGALYLRTRKPVKTAESDTSTAQWTAARALPVNWRLGDGDIVEATGAPAGTPWRGKYLKRAIAAKKEVTAGDLDMQPTIAQSGTQVLYLLPLAAGDEKNLNAGRHIDLIQGQTAIVGNVEVAAVRCPAACEAILQISQEARERLKGVEPATLKWVWR